jgi:3-oxoacyl-[acyl-carrier-protein] synthase II
MYINGVGNIAPVKNQHSEKAELVNGVLKAIEPDYKEFINPRLLRRMARIIKMGVAASNMALTDAQLDKPDAIITATGLGCLEDTEKFLKSIIEQNETLLSPTPFIQSTHNTIGGQIALLLGVTGYNMTYVQRDLSFESALLDAQLLLLEGQNKQVIIGGVDEFIDRSQFVLQQLNCVSTVASDGLPVGGEGASFFVAGAERTATSYAKVQKVLVTGLGFTEAVNNLLDRADISADEVDLVLTGAYNAKDFRRDYQTPINEIFNDTACGIYKHLSGFYFTAGAFACWLGATILKEQLVAEQILVQGSAPMAYRNVLIYNQGFGNQQSLILLSACYII